jgi:hypothetical protein
MGDDRLTPGRSERKLRLMLVACCRRVWHLLDDVRLRQGLELSARFADGLAGRDELVAAEQSALAARVEANERYQNCGVGDQYDRGALMNAANAALAAHLAVAPSLDAIFHLSGTSWRVWALAAQRAACAAAYSASTGGDAHRASEILRHEEVAQDHLIRDVFGAGLPEASPLPARLFAWEDAVTRLAASAYEGRQDWTLDPPRLWVLADALEEAGAHDELPAHLRGAEPHVRGCWVVDLCLGLS